MLDASNLHDYQRQCIDWILEHPKCALFVDMGLGKTITTLTAINELMYNRHEISRVLIVAPLRVARDTWVDEVQQWAHVRHLSVSVALGTPKQRTAALAEEADIYITSRDNIKWLVSQCKEWPYDCIVIDELSSFKSAKSQRFKSLKKVVHLTKRVIGLTGTPTSKGIEDLWSEIYLLDEGARLGKTLTEYRRNYMVAIPIQNYMIYKAQKGALERVSAKLTDICISMQAKDYLHLVPAQKIETKITLNAKAVKLYDTLKHDNIIDVSADAVAVADNERVMVGKLKQVASGAIYDDQGKWHELHGCKLEALREIVEEADDNILIAYEYRHELERIQRELPDAVLLGEGDTLQRWCRGEISVGIANAQSLGHGLNLQRGGSIIIWYSLPWSLEIYQQFNARLNRQGQTKCVRIYHLIARNTIDEVIMQVLNGRYKTQEAIINAVRVEIHGQVAQSDTTYVTEGVCTALSHC